MLRDASVSRMHARLEHVDGAWSVADTGSRNGLFVGGQRVQRAELVDGAEFTLGEVLLRFRADAGETGGASAHAEPESARASSRAPVIASDVPRRVETLQPSLERPQDAASSAPAPSAAAARGPADDEIELEGWDDDAPASAPPPLARAPLAPASASAPARPLAPSAGERGASSGIGARTSVAPAGVRERDRGVLQYHKVENRSGLFAADLGQQPLWVRTLVVVAALALFALVFWFVFRGTSLLKGDRGDEADVEAPSTE